MPAASSGVMNLYMSPGSPVDFQQLAIFAPSTVAGVVEPELVDVTEVVVPEVDDVSHALRTTLIAHAKTSLFTIIVP